MFSGKGKIISKLCILAFLLVGLGYVWVSPEQQVDAAGARCCQTCPGGYPPNATYCEDNCIDTTQMTDPPTYDYQCISDCEQAMQNCYSSCVVCGGGGGGGGGPAGSCSIDAHCSPGWRCQNGACYLGSRECYGHSMCSQAYPICWWGQCF